MENKPYLIFSLYDSSYAIAAEQVTEIFLLPELTPIVDAPPDILGLLNLHSQIVPVMHLDLRFGHAFEQCHLSDSVIVIESQGLQVGMIVHQVETVNNIDAQYIQADLSYGRERDINAAFVSGVINLDDETIVLLNTDNLIRHTDAVAGLVNQEVNQEANSELIKIGSFYDLYCPQATAREKAIFRQRAANLRISEASFTATELIPVAVVSLDGEYFGLDLGIVREFTKIERITTIPCCPEQIIGNMNLRGEILTLVDITQPLSLETKSRKLPSKAVVIDVDDIVAGIAVDEVFDVVYFRPEEIKPVPVAINAHTAEYLKGMAAYLNQPLNIIDLPKLLSQGVLTVELAA